MSFIHDNGVESRTLFEYDFSKTLKMFVNDDKTTYDFKNINNYIDVSMNIQNFLEEHEGMIAYDSVRLSGFGDTIKLSVGATENDYNYKKVAIDDEVYDVTAPSSLLAVIVVTPAPEAVIDVAAAKLISATVNAASASNVTDVYTSA